jgi:hypothetical protein
MNIKLALNAGNIGDLAGLAPEMAAMARGVSSAVPETLEMAAKAIPLKSKMTRPQNLEDMISGVMETNIPGGKLVSSVADEGNQTLKGIYDSMIGQAWSKDPYMAKRELPLRFAGAGIGGLAGGLLNSGLTMSMLAKLSMGLPALAGTTATAGFAPLFMSGLGGAFAGGKLLASALGKFRNMADRGVSTLSQKLPTKGLLFGNAYSTGGPELAREMDARLTHAATGALSALLYSGAGPLGMIPGAMVGSRMGGLAKKFGDNLLNSSAELVPMPANYLGKVGSVKKSSFAAGVEKMAAEKIARLLHKNTTEKTAGFGDSIMKSIDDVVRNSYGAIMGKPWMGGDLGALENMSRYLGAAGGGTLGSVLGAGGAALGGLSALPLVAATGLGGLLGSRLGSAANGTATAASLMPLKAMTELGHLVPAAEVGTIEGLGNVAGSAGSAAMGMGGSAVNAGEAGMDWLQPKITELMNRFKASRQPSFEA